MKYEKLKISAQAKGKKCTVLGQNIKVQYKNQKFRKIIFFIRDQSRFKFNGYGLGF